jgi:hypothetical protein
MHVERKSSARWLTGSGFRLATKAYLPNAQLCSQAARLLGFSLTPIRLQTIKRGGPRPSDCFQLWIHDVVPNPCDPSIALVRIHHPTAGHVEWTDELGEVVKGDRTTYLRSIGMIPRNRLLGDHHAGWKRNALDDKWYMELKWFPKDLGRIFLKLWQLYLIQVAEIERIHPFAWINFKGPDKGGIYSLEQFSRCHARAVSRLELVPGKNLGTTPYGHRHAYGQRLRSAGFTAEIRQRCMHHSSSRSQEIYTAPQTAEVNRELTAGEARLDAGLDSQTRDLLAKMGEFCNDTEVIAEIFKDLGSTE